MPDSPFYQPARQSFSSSQNMQQPQGGFGGFGGGQGFGGFQQQSWGGGFGGNQGFGGFGGGGFQPQGFGFGGGFGGGFQQQFNPYQGGFGGFGGFGGGYNPMFGGIGGLGFNPMMGPQFGMPMQEFGGYGDHYRDMSPQTRFEQYDPYRDPDQSQLKQMMAQRRPQYSPDRANESGMPMPGPTGRQSFDNPRMVQQPVDTSVAAFKNSQAYQDASKRANFGGGQQDLGYSKYGFTGNSVLTGALDRAYEDWQKSQPVQPTPQQPNVGVQAPMDGGGMTPSAQDMAQRQAQLQAMYGYSADMARQPMYGGIGGLGFNPMMGPQFGMPMQGFGFNPNARQEQQRWQQHVQNSLAMGVDPRSEEQIARGQSLKDWLSGRSV